MFTKFFWRKVGLEFARTFVAVFALGSLGALGLIAEAATDGTVTLDELGVAGSAVVAAGGGALAAAVRAAQALFTRAETPPQLKG